jgi:hypothetical protein
MNVDPTRDLVGPITITNEIDNDGLV